MSDTSDANLGNDLPPDHPASADTAISAGDSLSGREWQSGANLQDDTENRPPTETTAPTENQPDVPAQAPAEGSDDVPPSPNRRAEGADGGAASDIAQFLDVDPPASPATDADAPAPPG